MTHGESTSDNGVNTQIKWIYMLRFHTINIIVIASAMQLSFHISHYNSRNYDPLIFR